MKEIKKKASKATIKLFENSLVESQQYIKEHKKQVESQLPWLLDCTKDELEFIQDYYITKYQVIPSIKSFLKEPYTVSFLKGDYLIDENSISSVLEILGH